MMHAQRLRAPQTAGARGHFGHAAAGTAMRLPCAPQSRSRAGHRQQQQQSATRLVVARSGDGIGADAYCCVGLSHCFKKGDDGRLGDVMVIEPISSSSLECMATGAKTSFRFATGLTLGDAAARSRDRLPEQFADGVFCDEWAARLEAAARTWQRPHAQDNLMDLVPLGKVRGEFNFSLDYKRVLNFENVVTDDDNVKQDMSIDVYGRGDKKARDEAMAKQAAEEAEAAKATKEAEEADELDALLAA